jgi:hypothetical protein
MGKKSKQSGAEGKRTLRKEARAAAAYEARAASVATCKLSETLELHDANKELLVPDADSSDHNPDLLNFVYLVQVREDNPMTQLVKRAPSYNNYLFIGRSRPRR